MPFPQACVLPVLALSVGLMVPPGLDDPPTTAASAAPSARAAAADHVVAISVDGLNPRAILRLGSDRAPFLHRLRVRGGGTLNARSERELTVTLPNHTGMVTGRRVNAARGGHGVTWNDSRRRPRTVHRAAGQRVASVFSVVHAAGRSSAVFASKEKFTLFERSWPRAVDRLTIRTHDGRLVRLARRDLRRHARAFTFVHLSLPDRVGHRRGFMSPAYLRAVARVDGLVSRLVRTVRRARPLSGTTTVLLTSDHGGAGAGHNDPRRLASYRVPFLVWGAGVARHADLYDLNPDYAEPGRRRTGYAARRQPVRNGDVANLATDLLGLPAVSGSEHDAQQDLDVR